MTMGTSRFHSCLVETCLPKWRPMSPVATHTPVFHTHCLQQGSPHPWPQPVLCPFPALGSLLGSLEHLCFITSCPFLGNILQPQSTGWPLQPLTTHLHLSCHCHQSQPTSKHTTCHQIMGSSGVGAMARVPLTLHSLAQLNAMVIDAL